MLRTVPSMESQGMVQPCSEPSMQKRLPLGGGVPTGEQTPAAEEAQTGGPGREQRTRHLEIPRGPDTSGARGRGGTTAAHGSPRTGLHCLQKET